MRTKNLNLKKKIAFIASVAMIATTASYLPVGNFTADAAVIANTANAAKNYYDGTAKIAYAADNPHVLDTVSAFVKINGKYLCVNGTNDEYKLTNTADTSIGATWKPVLANEELDRILVAETSAKFGSEAVDANNDTMKVDTAATPLELPYIAGAETVTLEFFANEDSIMSERSIGEVEIPLNEYGMGKLNKQNEYVVSMSKNTLYDEDTDTWKAGATKGSYEVIDLSNLIVAMKKADQKDDAVHAEAIDVTKTAIESFEGLPTGAVVADYKHNSANGDNNACTFAAGTNKILEEKDIFDDTYEVKKIGNVYARVLTYTLKKAVAPDTVIKLNTGVYSTWTASGSNVSKGVVTLSTDKQGYATSGLITMTQGSNKEYYVYVVKNPLNTLENEDAMPTDKAFDGNLKFDRFATAAGGDTKDGTVSIGHNDTVYSPITFDGNYKIERKIVTEKIGDSSKKEYVTKYIVYNNQTADNFEGNETVTFTLSNAAANNKIFLASDRTVNPATGKITGHAAFAAGGNGSANTTLVKDENAGTQTITLKLSSAGTGETAVLDWLHGADANDDNSAFMIEFTNQYDIEYDNAWPENRTDATKNYDGKASVTGTAITNPGTVNRPGFEFKGWKMKSGNYAFNVDNGADRLNESEVTPNEKLTADYNGYYYNVELNSNGGYFVKNNVNGGSLTAYENYPGVGEKVPTKCTFANKKRDNNNDDILNGATGWKLPSAAVSNITGTNMKFLGWSTNKDAKAAMNTKELADAFPGENKTLTLYAVWAAEDTSVNFYAIGFDANGATLETDGKIAKADIKNAWKNAAKAEFERAADGYVTVTPGEKFGTLPTPYQKGYEFDGWYAAVFNNAKTEVTAEKVTEDSIVEAKYFADKTNMDGRLGTSVQLYAKFIQKHNSITFDIGDGLWANSEIDDEDGSLPAKILYNANTKALTYRRPNGTVIAENVWSAVANPKVGSDDFTKFRSWTINDGKTTYADLAAVKNALNKMDTLGDVVVKANYENTNQSQSNIFLNANEGAFYKYKAAENDATTKKPKYFYANDAADTRIINDDTDPDPRNWTYNVIPATGNDITLRDIQKSGLSFGKKTTGAKSDTVYKVDGVYVENVNAGDWSYQVARAGYTFTGWYTDKECTQPYTFDVYPAKGTETILYAGWKPSTSVRYWVEYDIFNGDKSEADDAAADAGSTLKFRKTYMGEIGETVNAKDIVVNVKSGAGTFQTTTKYVFDPVLSKNLDDQSKELKAKFDVEAIGAGRFEQATPYTTIYGRFVEDGYQNSEEPETPPVSKELGTATEVKVAADGTVTFKAAANAKKYQVAKIVGTKTYYSAKTEDTTIKITPTKADYKVYVIAFNEDGTKSTHSVVVSAKGTNSTATLGTVMDPVATEKLEADGTKTVTISWSKAENAAWYKVFKIVNGKKYWGSKVTDTSYVLKNIPATDSYIVYVAAGDGKGHVTYGARKKVSKFPSVKNVTVAPDNKTVTFDAVEGATAYQIAKIESNNKVNYSAKSTNPTITLKNAFKAGQKYYVLAFFKDEDGKTKSSYSDTFEVK